MTRAPLVIAERRLNLRLRRPTIAMVALHFDLTDLRLMLRVAAAASVTGGAEALHLSAPAASTRIKNLEESLGAKLLNRTSQGVTLTAPGRAFVHHARLVLGQVETLRGELQDYARGSKGHLRVFANTSALSEFLPPLLRDYLHGHPHVTIDLRERLSPDVVRAVEQGQTDIGIFAGNVRADGLQLIDWRSDRLVLIVPTDHPLAPTRSVSFAQTLEFDHVGLYESSALHTFLQRVCTQLDRPQKLRIQAGNFEAVCRMVEIGIGVSVLPGSAARRHGKTMNLAILELNDDWALRELRICVRRLDALPAFARKFVDMMLAAGTA